MQLGKVIGGRFKPPGVAFLLVGVMDMGMPKRILTAALAMLAMASFEATAQDLSGTAVRSAKGFTDACKKTEDAARWQLGVHKRQLYQNDPYMKVVREIIGDCTCHGSDYPPKVGWSCVVSWFVEVLDSDGTRIYGGRE